MNLNKWLLIVGAVLLVGTIANNFRVFYFQKDYSFSVEASCDPSVQTCFSRECSNDECPPNELEVYRVFSVPASKFSQCSDDSCLNECVSGAIQCEEVFCDESSGDICSSFQS